MYEDKRYNLEQFIDKNAITYFLNNSFSSLMRDLHWNQIGNLFLFSSVTDLLLPPLVILIFIKEGVVVFAIREKD